MANIKLPKLHNQILIALLLGIIFGAIFNVKENVLIITHQENKSLNKSVIKDWQEFTFIIPAENKIDSTTYTSKQQLEIISQYRKLNKEKTKYDVLVKKYFTENKQVNQKLFKNVTNIQKEATIATSIKWIGDIFIRLLNMIAIPLVLASLIVGAASLGDTKKFARIGGKTIVFYIATTIVAVTIGLLASNIIQPGKQMPEETKNKLMSSYQEDLGERIETQFEFDLSKELVNIIPSNIFDALTSSKMIQIVFFAVMMGLILTMVNKDKATPVINFFDGLSEAMIKMVDLIMYIAPLGVFALISATISEFGFEILQTLFWYAFTVILGLCLHMFGVYSLIIKFFTKIKVFYFFKAIRKAQTIAFTTSSSAATLPVNIECCQENLGISKSITSFVLPLGATINMDGTALYQGVATIFIAQVFGFDLSLSQQLIIIFTAVLASIGTAPVPGVGIIMLIIILQTVNIPPEGIALILGVDRILDMCRTVVNVTGDAVATSFIATTENETISINLENA
ncbi:MAG: hypothetical protein STSR0008_12560 [Ignavibacterium sp.]